MVMGSRTFNGLRTSRGGVRNLRNLRNRPASFFFSKKPREKKTPEPRLRRLRWLQCCENSNGYAMHRGGDWNDYTRARDRGTIPISALTLDPELQPRAVMDTDLIAE
jgi:hypothetical protein